MKHEWAEVIKAWADGKEIEWRWRGATNWILWEPNKNGTMPPFDMLSREWRVGFKWQAMKNAYERGERVQFCYPDSEWKTVTHTHIWDENATYRIADPLQSVKEAYFNGAKIQFRPRWGGCDWMDLPREHTPPYWSNATHEYRANPTPSYAARRFVRYIPGDGRGLIVVDAGCGAKPNVEFQFDHAGKLLGVNTL